MLPYQVQELYALTNCPLTRCVSLLTPSECGMARHKPQLLPEFCVVPMTMTVTMTMTRPVTLCAMRSMTFTTTLDNRRARPDPTPPPRLILRGLSEYAHAIG